MLKNLLVGLVISLSLLSCKKDDDNDQNQTTNTWEFTANGTTHKGALYFDPLLNTLLQGNNSYTFTMLGEEFSTGYTFNIVLSLMDTTFTHTTYQSGVAGNDYINSFFYNTSVGGNYIYTSTNHDAGPVLNYNIQSFNPSTMLLVFTFNGSVEDAGGNMVAVTNGKVTCTVEKM